MAKTKKMVAFVLVFAMLLTTGVLSFAQETDKSLMQETVYDFTKDEYDTDSLSWLNPNLARHDENGLTNYDSWFAFGPMKKFGKAGYGYEAWVEASIMDRDTHGAINNALCLGVRNDNMADIFLQQGLWFFIRSNGVSVSLGNADGSYFDRSAIRLANCPVSFAENTKITIKD